MKDVEMIDRDRAAALGLGALLAGAAVAHFARPGFFDAIVPEALPGSARMWTYASGVAEGVTGALVLHPRTRRRGGLLAAALFVAVFPANVKQAFDSADASTGERVATLLRLPLQIPLVLWGLRVARSTPPGRG